MDDDPAEMMLQILEMMAPVREAMVGYRAQLEADGWTPTSAEKLAMDLFLHLQQAITKPVR